MAHQTPTARTGHPQPLPTDPSGLGRGRQCPHANTMARSGSFFMEWPLRLEHSATDGIGSDPTEVRFKTTDESNVDRASHSRAELSFTPIAGRQICRSAILRSSAVLSRIPPRVACSTMCNPVGSRRRDAACPDNGEAGLHVVPRAGLDDAAMLALVAARAASCAVRCARPGCGASRGLQNRASTRRPPAEGAIQGARARGGAELERGSTRTWIRFFRIS